MLFFLTGDNWNLSKKKTMAFTRPQPGAADEPIEVFFCLIPVL